MSAEKASYNPTPGDYNVQLLAGTEPKPSPYESAKQSSNNLQSKIYSRPSESMNSHKNDSDSSKQNPATRPLPVNNSADVFEYKEQI